MNTNLLECQSCRSHLPPESIASPEARCPSCNTAFRIALFPALFQNRRNGKPAQPLRDEGQSSCFHHGDKQAAMPCDQCGRYLCNLRDIEMYGQHYCPDCIQTMARDENNVRSRVDYPRFDRLVFYLAGLPILLFPFIFFTFITGPLALGLGFYAWKRCYNPVRSYRGTLIAGMAIALFETLAWMGIFASMAIGLFQEFS